MNEPRIIYRHCAVCGKDIEVKLSGRKHWWQKRKILSGGYFFFSDLGRTSGRWSWHTKFLGCEKSKSRIHQFLSNHIWWWSIPEGECSVPNWKKPYYMFRQWLENKLDPPDYMFRQKAEYWECPDCFHSSLSESEEDEE